MVTMTSSASVALKRWATLPLRFAVGYGFIAHGYAKYSRGPDTFAAILHTLGVPMPALLAWLTTLVEMIGGFAIMIGAYVQIASLPLAIVLLVALFTIHLPYGFFSVKLVEVTTTGTRFGPVGYEIIIMYLAGLISIVLSGAGPLSFDHWRSARLSSPARMLASPRAWPTSVSAKTLDTLTR